MTRSASSAESCGKPPLIVVDDDPLILESLGAAFEDSYEVFCAKSPREVRSTLRQMPEPPECAVVDLGLPPARHSPDEGFGVIRAVLAAAPACAVVVVSGQDSEQNARLARTMGAADFIAKPAEPARILEALEVAKRARGEPSDEGFVGESPAAELLRERIRALAAAPYPILIEGETGCGKELAARALHSLARPGKPFLALNCAAIPGQLFEATLFGHRRGAFTGATADSSGYFGDADGGTLFLDEIGELVPELQPKLLRTLETGEYQRVGETAPRTTAASVVAATNRDLRSDVAAGRFRVDLYHRLSVLKLEVPALRELGGDRRLLLDRFGEEAAQRLGTARFSLGADALALWDRYRFPGNVRELRNVVIRLQAKFPGAEVAEAGLADELFLEPEFSAKTAGLIEYSMFRERAESALRARGAANLERETLAFRRACAEAALRAAGGDRAAAAALLECDEPALDGLLPPEDTK